MSVTCVCRVSTVGIFYLRYILKSFKTHKPKTFKSVDLHDIFKAWKRQRASWFVRTPQLIVSGLSENETSQNVTCLFWLSIYHISFTVNIFHAAHIKVNKIYTVANTHLPVWGLLMLRSSERIELRMVEKSKEEREWERSFVRDGLNKDLI